MKRIFQISAAIFAVLMIISYALPNSFEVKKAVQKIALGPRVTSETEDDAWNWNGLEFSEIVKIKVRLQEFKERQDKDGFPGITEFVFPLCPGGQNVRLSSGYGRRINPITKKPEFHHGNDLTSPKGTGVVNVSEGVVLKTGRSKIAGKYVIVLHRDRNGKYLTSTYCHLDKVYVDEGEVLPIAGLVMGTVGTTGQTTGPHLHFALREMFVAKDGHLCKGRWIDPTKFVSVKNPKKGADKFLAKYGEGDIRFLAELIKKDKR